MRKGRLLVIGGLLLSVILGGCTGGGGEPSATPTVTSGAASFKSAALDPSGKVDVGKTLTLTYEVVPADAEVTVVWFTDDVVLRVGGAVFAGSSYTVVAADKGKGLIVKLTATVPGHDPVVKYTNRVTVTGG